MIGDPHLHNNQLCFYYVISQRIEAIVLIFLRGELFLIVCPNTSLENAVLLAKK